MVPTNRGISIYFVIQQSCLLFIDFLNGSDATIIFSTIAWSALRHKWKTGGVLYIEPPSMCVSYLSIDGIDLRTLPRADFPTNHQCCPCRSIFFEAPACIKSNLLTSNALLKISMTYQKSMELLFPENDVIGCRKWYYCLSNGGRYFGHLLKIL